MTTEDARALLQSTQQLRTLWAGVVSRDFVYAVVVNAAIWTYFLKAYVDSSATNPTDAFSYLAVAAGLSSLVLGLWRVFTRHTYDRIAGLYPDLLIFEKHLGVEPERGTAGYLVRAIPRLYRVLVAAELNPGQKGEAVSFLVREKSLGRLSHLVIDMIVIAFVIGMFGLCVSVHSKLQLAVAIGSLIAIVFSV